MNSVLIGVEGELHAVSGFIELSDPESFFDTLWSRGISPDLKEIRK